MAYWTKTQSSFFKRTLLLKSTSFTLRSRLCRSLADFLHEIETFAVQMISKGGIYNLRAEQQESLKGFLPTKLYQTLDNPVKLLKILVSYVEFYLFADIDDLDSRSVLHWQSEISVRLALVHAVQVSIQKPHKKFIIL